MYLVFFSCLNIKLTIIYSLDKIHLEIENPAQINTKTVFLTETKNINQEYNNKLSKLFCNTKNSNSPNKQKSKFFEHNIINLYIVK